MLGLIIIHCCVCVFACTHHLWICAQGDLGPPGWGMSGTLAGRGLWGQVGSRIVFSGDKSNSTVVLYRPTAVCLPGECLQVVLFYSSLQVLECPLRRERFEPGTKLWAEFQVSSKNSQSYSCPLLAGQKGFTSGFSLLRGLTPKLVPSLAVCAALL